MMTLGRSRGGIDRAKKASSVSLEKGYGSQANEAFLAPAAKTRQVHQVKPRDNPMLKRCARALPRDPM